MVRKFCSECCSSLICSHKQHVIHFSKRLPKHKYKPVERPHSSLESGCPDAPADHTAGMYPSCSMPELNRPQTAEKEEKGNNFILNLFYVKIYDMDE